MVVSLVLIFLLVVSNAPVIETAGRIITIDVAYGSSKYINDYGFSPTGKYSIRGRYKGCSGAEVRLMETESGQYLWILIGYYTNGLDAFYLNGWLEYTWISSLDCDAFKEFWFSWDGRNGFKYGTGLVVGKNVVLETSSGPSGMVNYVKLGVLDNGVTGVWEWIVDEPPYFVTPSPDGKTQVSVYENGKVGERILILVGSDPDGDKISFSLDNYQDKFAIEGFDLRTVTPLDYEEKTFYTVTITVSDDPNTVQESLTVVVLNVFDETPVVQLTDPPITISEEMLPGSSVGVVFAVTDADDGDEMTCTITGDDAVYISTGDTCGVPKLTKRVDFDGNGGRSVLDKLTVEVKDKGGNKATVDFVINVADVNDNTPTFAQSSYTVNMAENTKADTSLMNITASDADSGNNKLLTYKIARGNDAGRFQIIANTLVLAPAVSDVDYKSDTQFQLTVTAADNPDEGPALTGSTTVTVIIDPVNEFTPTWTKAPADQSVAEDVFPTTLIQTVTATDDDNGVDGNVIYEIVSATDNKGRDSAELFSLDSKTGEFRLAKNLDHDDYTDGASSHVVVVRARDDNASPKSVQSSFTVTVEDVNDLAPVFGKSKYSVTVAEDKVVGTTVLTVKVTEYDSNDNYSLSLLTSEFFEVVGTDVKILKKLDYEEIRFYDLVVRATDGGNKHVVDVPLTITVANVVDEAPVITVTPVTLQEEVPVGTVVVNAGFHVTDRDEGDTLTYSLKGSDAHFFNVDKQTGEMLLVENINRDGPDGVTSLTDLSVTVADSAELSDTKSLNISIADVNDNTPMFSAARYTAEVAENSASDTSVLLLAVSDIDEGKNADVVLAIAKGDPLGNFKMAGLQLQTTSRPIDFEALKDSDYSFTLVVIGTDSPTDGAAKTGSTVVSVKVSPQNEFDPQWVTSISGGYFPQQTISEGDNPGTSIATFSAEDKDHGKDGEIVYSVVKETTNEGNYVTGVFVVDSRTGTLAIASVLDVDNSTGGVAYYDVILSATDNGNPARSATGTVQVVLTGVNDLPPVFTESTYSVSVKESAPVDYVIMSITATDEDGDAVTYNVTETLATASGNDIILKEKLDYEAKRVHVITVHAKDGKHTTETLVTVNVEDVVDEPPKLIVSDNIVMPEEQLTGTIVGGLFNVRDADDTDSHTFSINGTSSKYFNIDTSTGVVTVKSRISREDGLQVLEDLQVTVVDAAGLSDTQTLSITVKDVNDNPPTFSQTSYTAEVTEASATATKQKREATLQKIFDFSVTDKDEGANSNYVLSIGGGNVNDAFSIEGNSLMAYSKKIDYEALQDQNYQYSLTILAVDTPTNGQPMTGTAVITVKVNGVDEYDPEWSSSGVVPDSTGSFPNVSVSESAGFGTPVVTLTAVDRDAGPDGQLQYKVVSITRKDKQTERNTFSFNSTGTLFTSSVLDADISTGGTEYYVVVVAAVGGESGKSVTGTLTVFLEDEPDIEAAQETELWVMRGMALCLAAVTAGLAAILIKKMWPVPEIDPLPSKYERPDMVEPQKYIKELDLKLEDF